MLTTRKDMIEIQTPSRKGQVRKRRRRSENRKKSFSPPKEEEREAILVFFQHKIEVNLFSYGIFIKEADTCNL